MNLRYPMIQQLITLPSVIKRAGPAKQKLNHRLEEVICVFLLVPPQLEIIVYPGDNRPTRR